jgi:hypothetical protein
MKPFFTLIAVFTLLFVLGCAETGKDIQKEEAFQGQPLYTAYNIWRLNNPWQMRCINYKYGHNFIPAGTKVRDVKISEDQNGRPVISFVTIHDDRRYNIYFTSRWHPGNAIEDYKNYMFTTETFEELTSGMSDREISAIKNGTSVDGMSKEAVLAVYGRPPEHRTPSLQRSTWYYWRNKFKNFEVCFDNEERTTFCK